MMKNRYLKTDNSGRIILRYFLILFLSLTPVFLGVIALLYVEESEEKLERVKKREKENITVQKEIIEHTFGTIVSDLEFLSRQNEINQFIRTGAQDQKQLAAKEYLEFCRRKGIYDQIRFIDKRGHEVIRINNNDGTPSVTPENALQDKSGRYYFKNTIALGCNQIFMSTFDLNVENGKIEKPFKPMIRFGTPLCSTKDTKSGILIVNYLGDQLLDLIKATNANIMVVNSDGYWLYSPQSQDTWGFMIKEREDRKFQTDFPREWTRIHSLPESQFRTRNGLFTSVTIYPLRYIQQRQNAERARPDAEPFRVSTEERYWKIISHIPEDVLQSQARGILTRFVLIAVMTCVLTGLMTWLIAKGIARRKLRQMELYELANFDRLTGLPNRAHLLRDLHEIHEKAQTDNGSYALLFIDLDGFKAINDNLGHNAGDLVLIGAAKRFSECLRQDDMVARFGGDEFVIILPQIRKADDVTTFIKRLEANLKKPLQLADEQRTIGASIGASFYPNDGDTPESLLQKADAEMYKAKAAKK